MIEIKMLTNAALAYVINCYLDTDCWRERNVADWREKLDRGYVPGVETNEGGEDTPCLRSKSEDNHPFLCFLRDNFDGKVFTFDDVSLLGEFCCTFIGTGLDEIHVNVTVYPYEEGMSQAAMLEDGSWYQRFDFKINGAEEFNALSDFVEELDKLYEDNFDGGHKWHIVTTNLEESCGWFFQV